MTGAIDTPDRPAAEVDRLLDDLNDWMDLQGDDAFAGERPIGAILWTACQALDLPVDLTVWELEDWAPKRSFSVLGAPPTAPPHPPTLSRHPGRA